MPKFYVTLTYSEVIDAKTPEQAIGVANMHVSNMLESGENLDAQATNLDVESMLKMARETKAAMRRGSEQTAGDYARQTAHYAFNANPGLRDVSATLAEVDVLIQDGAKRLSSMYDAADYPSK